MSKELLVEGIKGGTRGVYSRFGIFFIRLE
jgi:hypothetical protein